MTDYLASSPAGHYLVRAADPISAIGRAMLEDYWPSHVWKVTPWARVPAARKLSLSPVILAGDEKTIPFSE